VVVEDWETVHGTSNMRKEQKRRSLTANILAK
jgi:hypothetical protein